MESVYSAVRTGSLYNTDSLVLKGITLLIDTVHRYEIQYSLALILVCGVFTLTAAALCGHNYKSAEILTCVMK